MLLVILPATAIRLAVCNLSKSAFAVELILEEVTDVLVPRGIIIGSFTVKFSSKELPIIGVILGKAMHEIAPAVEAASAPVANVPLAIFGEVHHALSMSFS